MPRVVKKRRWLLGAAGVLVALGGLFAFASVDRCGEWKPRAPALLQVAVAQGPLLVGAAKVPLTLSFPTTVGGYPPPRASVDKALSAFAARALVIDLGAQRLRLVVLDVLLIPPQLRDAIAANRPGPIWVAATHTHSGPSGFDPRAASEVAALGSYDPAAFQRLVEAAQKALDLAEASLAPAQLEVGESQSNALSTPRSGDASDTRITRARFDAATGPLAQLVVLAGHPTLTPRRPDGLHADWPGLLAERFEANGGPVTLVLQGAGGTAMIDRAVATTAEVAAEKAQALIDAVPTERQAEPLSGAWNEVRISLPRPQAPAAVPSVLRPLAENLLCADAEDIVLLHGLRLGALEWLFVPVEPTLNAGLVLEEQARVQRVVGLSDGYAGYVELEQVARAGGGEAQRQYFPPTFLGQLSEGARLAGQALDAPR